MARRNFAAYKASVVHALGGNPASGVDKGEIVNDALQNLASLHRWNWRRGGPISLSITGGQDYVELPADFGEDYAITYPGSFAQQMIRTTVAEIMRYRASPITATFGFTYFYAVNTGQTDEDYTIRQGGTVDPSDPTLGLSLPVLEIYPTPEADAADAISAVYIRDMPRLEAEEDIPAIPTWMDYAFDLLCRSFAMTLEDDNPQNSAQVMFDALIPKLISRDGSSQRRLGVMLNGLWPRTTGIDPLFPDTIGDPVSM